MRILLSVASKHGSTAEIGKAIAVALRDGGPHVMVDEIDPQLVDSVEGYDGVILGSAIYADAMIPGAFEMAVRLEPQLRSRPFYVFVSGPMSDMTDEARVPGEVRELGQRLAARCVRVFGGKIDRAGLGSVERIVVRALGARDGDWRDLGEATSWARWILFDIAAA